MPAAAKKPPLSVAAGTFGLRVREARADLGLSQEALAEDSELHWSYIGQVERGQNNLTLHNILRIAAALEVDPGDLVRGLEAPPTHASDRRRAPRRQHGARTRSPD